MRRLAVCIVALSMIAGGCGKSEVSDSGEQAADVSPESRAKENSKDAAEAIAASKKGVDEDGQKIWMQDAREFFDNAANPKNRTFELPWKWSVEFTRKAYAAGAEKVLMVNINVFELGQNQVYISDEMVVVLPKDASKRRAVFDIYNAAVAESAPEDKLVDVGQQYIYILGD